MSDTERDKALDAIIAKTQKEISKVFSENPMPRLDAKLPPPVGYITRAEADAMVAAALRMAIEMVKDGMFIVAPEGVRQREALASYRAQAASLIASLTPADAVAALDEVRRQARRVKPLVWIVYSNNGNCCADTSFGKYTVEDCYEDGWGMWTPREHDDGLDPANGFHQTLEAAKAAAQSDYEARILAALEEPK